MHLPIVPLDPWLAQFGVASYIHQLWGLGVVMGLLSTMSCVRFYALWRSPGIPKDKYQENLPEIIRAARWAWVMLAMAIFSPVLGFYIVAPTLMILVGVTTWLYIPPIRNFGIGAYQLFRDMAGVAIGRRA